MNSDQRREAFRLARAKLMQDAIEAGELFADVELHRFKNLKAATRLLFGARAAGDISDREYAAALRKLKKVEQISFDEVTHISKMNELYSKSARKKTLTLSDRLEKDAYVLVVDDEVNSLGWGHVFQTIFGGRALCADSRQMALEIIHSEAGSRLALVLLDLKMPVAAEGLQTLIEIKHARFDLPVIMFSAVDETIFAKKCFACGASDYYVKELGPDDRSSMKYYEKFKDAVTRSLWDPEWRHIWRAIQSIREPEEYSEGRRLYKSTIDHLLRAFFFLTTDTDDPRARLLFSRDTIEGANIYGHCVLECANAVEGIITEASDKLKVRKLGPDRIASISQTLGKVVPRQFREKLKALAHNRIIKEEMLNSAKSVWSWRRGPAHGKYGDQKLAKKAFRAALDFVNGYFASPVQNDF